MFRVNQQVASFVGLLVCTCAAAARASADVPSFRGLGSLGMTAGGQPYSTAGAVSRDGRFVAGTTATEGGYVIYRWTAGSGMEALPIFGRFPSESATGISDDGSTVVGAHHDPTVVGDPSHAYRYSAERGVERVVNFPYDVGNWSKAVSADGWTVVGQTRSRTAVDQPFYNQGFRWAFGGPTNGVGFHWGGTYSDLAGLSSNGRIAAGTTDHETNIGYQAFLFDIDAGPSLLGDLPGGAFFSTARGISSDGTIVVGQGTSASGPEAFRRTAAGGMVGLGDLAGGAFDSVAIDLSDDGSVVVGVGTSGRGREAFVWDPGHGMRLLQSVLADLGVYVAGWTLTDVAGVSADGTTIVGTGISPSGNTEAWVAVVPEPAAVSLLLIPALLALRRLRPRLERLNTVASA